MHLPNHDFKLYYFATVTVLPVALEIVFSILGQTMTCGADYII